MAVLVRKAFDELWAIAASATLPVWGARIAALLLPQGTLAFLYHVYMGFEVSHADFPFGIKLDPLHALTHVAWGAAGAYVGFLRLRWAVPYLILFGVYYVTLSFFGTFTPYHFGLQLGERENFAHWTLGPLGLVAGLFSWWHYGLWQQSDRGLIRNLLSIRA